MRLLTVGAVGVIVPASATVWLSLLMVPVQAESIVPTANGTGTQVTPNGTDHTITGGVTSADQQNLFHQFTEFHLLTGESATFVTDPAVLNVLSGVTSANPSVIDGLLQVSGSNANLFLINPNGILLGPNAALNLQGSFTAVTSDQVNFATGSFDLVGASDYVNLVGNPQSFSFSLEHPASVVNMGDLAVSPGASVVLLGGQVLNTGTIAAPGGEIVISAVEGSNLVRIAQAGSLLNLELATLAAASDRAEIFSPLSLPALLTGHESLLADTVAVMPDGTVQLVTGTMVDDATGSAIVAGTVDVEHNQGGQILVLGQDITLTGTLLNASGADAGGLVRVGGDYQGQGVLPRAQTTELDADSQIRADALNTGNGGEVIVWADGTTLFQGLITARGGPNGGDGGLVETSGRQAIDIDGGRATASATQGTAGLWFVDPDDINIDGDLAVTIENTLAEGTSFEVSTITGQPPEAIVTSGNGDIFLNSKIDATADNNATLTLTASRYIQRGEDEFDVIPFINIAGGNLVLNLNQEGLADPTNPTINNALDIVGTVEGMTEINLGFGTYEEPDTIFLKGDMRLQGSGAESPIIDGFFGNDADSVIVVSAASEPGASATQINNLTITGGTNNAGSGGGIRNEGNLIINNSVILDHEAATTGGGIANIRLEESPNPEDGTLVINNSVILENQSGADGGGISNEGGSLTINASIINGNVSEDDGGGVDNNDDGGTVTIRNSTIANNTADFDGGGVENGSSMTIANSTIAGNTAASGGGIVNSGGILTVNNSTISNNRADVEGGGIDNESGTLTVNSSTIHSNFAGSVGGGIDNGPGPGTATISNSTIFNNTATEVGGGIFNDRAMIISNSTIVANTADAGGGIVNSGIFDSDDDRGDDGTLTITSSLVSGNRANEEVGFNIGNEAILISGGNNLFGSSNNSGVFGLELAASDIVPTVPLDAILENVLLDNGGPTPTLALVAGSPAINTGSGSGPDQRGFPVVDGTRDIGAYEFGAGDGGSSTDADFECVAGDCSPLTIPPSEDLDSSSSNGTEPTDVQQFEDYLGVEAAAFEDVDALNRARNSTGVTSAIVYASFVSSSAEAEATAANLSAVADVGTAGKELAVNDELGRQIVAQAEGRLSAQASSNTQDVLQLVLVTSDSTPRRINTGATRREVLAAVRQLQIELTDRTRRRLDTYLSPSQSLYGWLMTPLEAALAAEDIGHVSFVLDEGLRSLPLAALHDGEQFIIETYSVGLMPSLSLTDTRIGNIRNAAVLAMGASEFTDQPPLPAVPLEIAAIGDLRSGEAYLNEAFTLETLVEQRAEDAYPILHLATHGQFTTGELSNSYIQFWDQRLGLDELPQLQLGDPAVELMVLSACRTVLGDSEAELGFAGLAIKSGAKSAIAALWQVSDLETAGLMAELYTQLGTVTYKAEALRQAQLAMLRGEVTVQDNALIWSGGSEPLPDEFRRTNFADTRHPYYWSAFTLVGNPW
ncbi:MAG: CHAT domain-containing protein [Cyanobacteria bacterium P01_F01_bin.56]